MTFIALWREDHRAQELNALFIDEPMKVIRLVTSFYTFFRVIVLVSFSVNASPWAIDQLPSGSARYTSAIQLLHTRQNPIDCSTASAMMVIAGRGGGFGSQFQHIAKFYAGALGAGGLASGWLNRSTSLPIVLIMGDMKSYTRNSVCERHLRERTASGEWAWDASMTGWGCFFEPVSRCTLRVRKQNAPNAQFVVHPWSGDAMRIGMRPAEYKRLDSGMAALGEPGFWWGVVLDYLARLNSRMRTRLEDVKMTIDYGTGERAPVLAMHIRVGDKHKDPDSHTNPCIRLEKEKNSRKRAQIQADCNSFEANDPKAYIRVATTVLARIRTERCSKLLTQSCPPLAIFVATDSLSAATTVQKWALSKPNEIRLVMANAVASFELGANSKEVAKELQKASGDMAYTAAEEVITDLHLMLGVPNFIGLCMSQLARTVVAIGYARGTLVEAVALDHAAIDKRQETKLNSTYMPWVAAPATSTARTNGLALLPPASWGEAGWDCGSQCIHH